MSKTVKKASNVDDHPLIVEINRIADEIDKFKERAHPKDVNTKKVYHDDAPSKGDFVSLRSAVKHLIKDVTAAVKLKNKREKKDKREVKAGAGFLRMVKLKPALAEFIGTEKKKLGDVYSDALLTSYFTNYFYTSGCKDHSYIVPNKELINLFRTQFREAGVIDSHDELIKQVDVKKDGTKQSFKGFKFIHLQRLLKDHIVLEPGTKKRMPVPREGNEKLIEILEKEKIVLDKIRDARQELDDVTAKHAKRAQMAQKAKELGDSVAFEREIREIEKEKNKKEKELRYLCEDNKFPYQLN